MTNLINLAICCHFGGTIRCNPLSILYSYSLVRSVIVDAFNEVQHLHPKCIKTIAAHTWFNLSCATWSLCQCNILFTSTANNFPLFLSPSEFINLISSESNEVCSREDKRTIAPEHVLKALEVFYSIILSVTFEYLILVNR